MYDCILARLGKHLIRDNVTFCIPSLTCERAGQMHYKGKMGTRAHTHTHWKNSRADADQCGPKQQLNANQCNPRKPTQSNANQCEPNANTINKCKQIKSKYIHAEPMHRNAKCKAAPTNGKPKRVYPPSPCVKFLEPLSACGTSRYLGYVSAICTDLRCNSCRS